jgi:hypothetical protein
MPIGPPNWRMIATASSPWAARVLVLAARGLQRAEHAQRERHRDRLAGLPRDLDCLGGLGDRGGPAALAIVQLRARGEREDQAPERAGLARRLDLPAEDLLGEVEALEPHELLAGEGDELGGGRQRVALEQQRQGGEHVGLGQPAFAERGDRQRPASRAKSARSSSPPSRASASARPAVLSQSVESPLNRSAIPTSISRSDAMSGSASAHASAWSTSSVRPVSIPPWRSSTRPRRMRRRLPIGSASGDAAASSRRASASSSRPASA